MSKPPATLLAASSRFWAALKDEMSLTLVELAHCLRMVDGWCGIACQDQILGIQHLHGHSIGGLQYELSLFSTSQRLSSSEAEHDPEINIPIALIFLVKTYN